jgi:glucose-6-phosphate-specific signal transduction histidine kinase
MPDKIPSKKKRLRDLKPLWLLIALIAISVLHYENVSGSVLLHEISQRLYYLPIIYAAYRYGLRGGLTASLVSAALYFPHIVQHWANKHSTINQYAETILFLVIGVVTGLLAGK